MTTLRTHIAHSGITIDYANGSGFVHGGSGPLTVYSDDEKAAINALTDANDGTYYLFLVSSVTKLDADGNNTVVSGYMPVGYQHGFIFEQFDVARTIAHELSHGAFALHHTFSANTESFHANEGTTNNLMDYAEGATLNYKQWSWMHEKHGKGLFGFLADEEDAEAIFETYYVDFTTDKFRDLHEIFKDKTEITYVTPGGRFITLPIAFKPNFTGTFVKSKSKEKVIPRVPDGVLFSFYDASGNYWGAHMSVKDGKYYFLGYHKKEGDAYTDEYYTESLSSKLGTSAEVLLGLDPGCDLELYITNCGVLKEAQTDNKGDDMVPDALAIESLDKPVYSLHSHNKSCLGELGLKFYSEHAENVTDEDLLNKIFNVAKLIDKCGYNLYNDYKDFTGNSNSNYWDEGVWKSEERYEILEKSLNAYTTGKDELEQLLKQYDNNEDKFTTIAWMLVERYYASISVETRHYILNKLSKSSMYGNPLFGSGQEYLALKLIKTTPKTDVEELVDLLKGDNTLKNLYYRIDDEGGRDNFTTFILMLSELALHSDNHKVNAKNVYIWDDSFIDRFDINYKISFQDDGNLRIDVFKTDVQGDITYKTPDDEKSLKDIDPFTWLPIRYRGKSQYLPEKSGTYKNMICVPAIYLMALQTKHMTAVTKVSIETAVDVVSLFFGLGEIKVATTAAIRVISAIDAIANVVDIVVTWSENDIKKLEGGDEFLEAYEIFSAVIGAATFSADNFLKNSVISDAESVTDFLKSWNSLCKNYSKDVPSSKLLVEAVGKDNYIKIEKEVNVALESLKKEGIDIDNNIRELQSTIAKNAGIEGNGFNTDLENILSKLLDDSKRRQFEQDFFNASEDVLSKFTENSDLVVNWNIIREKHSVDCKDINVLEKVDGLRKLPNRDKIGFTDDVIADIKGVFYGPDNLSTIPYKDVLETCEDFVKAVNANNIDIGDFSKIIGDLSKGQSFTPGAEWTVRYIGKHGNEFAGKKLNFEVIEEIGDKIRRVDLKVYDENLGKNIFYEFKSVKDVPPAHFLEQFGKDLANSEVSDLSQIKWIFDGKKVSQEQLTNAIKKAVDDWNVSKELVKKYRPLDEDVTIFKTDIISIFNAE